MPLFARRYKGNKENGVPINPAEILTGYEFLVSYHCSSETSIDFKRAA
jgi:hypothetical protein